MSESFDTKEYHPELIDTVVIGGGGTAGYCYMGAMREIFSEDNPDMAALSRVKTFVGTSAGSIIATILSCTTDQDYLLQKFESFDVSALQDNTFGFIVDLYRLYTKLGYNKGKYALDIAREVMDDLTGNPNITFAELYARTSNNLVITGVNTSTRQIVYFNRLTHPNMEVATAVRISMSLPLIFVPIEHTNELYTDILGETALYVDGGLIDNYPVHFVMTELYDLLHNEDSDKSEGSVRQALESLYHLDDERALDEDQRRERLCRTIGIKSYSRETMTNIAPETKLVNHNNRRFTIKTFASELVSILMDNGLKRHITNDIWDRTVKIDVGTLSTTDFDIDEEDIQNMLAIGKTAGEKFLIRN